RRQGYGRRAGRASARRSKCSSSSGSPGSLGAAPTGLRSLARGPEPGRDSGRSRRRSPGGSRLKRRSSSLLLALVLLGSSPGWAEPPARPRVEAARAQGPIRIDGLLDEPDWSRAEPITAFRLIFQREGEAPSESTEVRVLYDD